MTQRASTHHRHQLAAALLITWIVWGSTFLALHYAAAAMPPLLLMGSRFVVAGVLASAFGMWQLRGTSVMRRARRAVSMWRDSALVGLGLITVGMGATSWAATRLPTGIAALLVASAPLWTVLFAALAKQASITPLVSAGLSIGMIGVGALVIAPASSAGPAGAGIDVVAAVTLVLANAAWAAASVYAQRVRLPRNVFLTIGAQMTLGGIALVLTGVALGEQLDAARIIASPSAIGAWGFLVVAGSLAGYFAYGWLLKHTSAATASTHAFVNPLVAVALGAAVLGEPITTLTIGATLAIAIAVLLLLVGEHRAAAKPAPAALRGVAPRPRGRLAHGRMPAPTPAFAQRRGSRPWQATDGMDALAIDAAFDLDAR
jgi:drug/metabolite transporter (DMT)-like permease